MKSAVVTACALSLGVFAVPAPPARAEAPPPAGCSPAGELKFVCGLTSVEDMLPVGGGRWLVGGSFKAGSAGLYLIDTRAKRARPAALSIAARPDPAYPCSPPDLKGLSTHGVDVRQAGDGTATVFTINHGGREAVEVWRLDPARGAAEWIGCVALPPGVDGNSVAALADGRIAVTKFMDPRVKDGFQRLMAGERTGAVLIWTPGQGFAELPGSQLAGDNGLVVSPDARWLYVAAYGSGEVWRLPLAGGGERSSVKLQFHPDNLRWAPDGGLFVTGQFFDAGTSIQGRHGWATVRLDPRDMTVAPLVREPGRAEFDDGTSAVQVGDTLWFGTFRGDRVAYRTVPRK